ncbi:MAG: Rpn family recombination-promoting nuclease/putative transposase [Oscillospiraceae bacterium]|nr:Rpn family recombination-promoting nuclease/putative transposase [Oscillospiraceae bacterium]
MNQNQQPKNNNFLMQPKVDFAFKEIMMDDDALKGFLSAVLNINPEHIRKIFRKNTNMQKVHKEEKQAILDVRIVIAQAKPPKKRKRPMSEEEQEEKFILKEIDIEIQLSYMAAWADRSVFYVAKMLVEQGEIDQKYSNFKKCIGINLLDFNYIDQTQKFHTVWHIREDSEHIKYTDTVEWHVVELPKLPSIPDGTDLYKWVQFLKAETKEEFEMIVQGNHYLESALKRLEVISQDEQKRLEYTARQKTLYDYNTFMEENYDRGYDDGRAEGKQEKESELIAKWKAKGMTDEEINALLN